jgi:ribosome-associated heat shock protein Hsp15
MPLAFFYATPAPRRSCKWALPVSMHRVPVYTSGMSESVRLDKWLWAARFFKTRALAREAVAGGKVHLNGNRAKPGRALNAGDELRVQRGHDEYTVRVVELAVRRGSAAVAQGFYEETEESRRKREELAELRKLANEARTTRERRPDKRQRRRIIRFKSGME